MELEAGSPSSICRLGYDEEFVGKTVKKSKVRVTWKFVVAGRKHSIIVNWSKRTGKQELFLDGSSVWFGRNKGRSVLDHHWQTETLKLHVLGTCAPKLSVDFRSYDLLINGQLFASLPCYDRTEENTETQWAPQHDKTHPRSIIEVLYPGGYTPPVDNNQSQQGEQPQQAQPIVVQAYPVTSTNNGVTQPPMVDLLT